MKTNMSQRATRLFQLSLLAGTLLLWTGLLIPSQLLAEPEISARYVQASGTKLSIEITTGSQPPTSVILTQHLPSEVMLLDSQPRHRNFNAKKNRVKWLLRNLKPGTSTVRMTLDRAVVESNISAEIQFKPTQGGKTMTIQVQK